MVDADIERSRFADLTPHDLYDILRLRSEVFVVEQDCVYLDPDGRDREPDAIHLWIRDESGIAGALRILDPGADTASMGRIVTRPDVRSRGVASRLVHRAIDLLESSGSARIDLSAQAHLARWYEGLGFAVSGPGYVEDGIPHLPMTRPVDAHPGRAHQP